MRWIPAYIAHKFLYISNKHVSAFNKSYDRDNSVLYTFTFNLKLYFLHTDYCQSGCWYTCKMKDRRGGVFRMDYNFVFLNLC